MKSSVPHEAAFVVAAKADRVNANARRLAKRDPGAAAPSLARGNFITRLSLLDRVAIVAIGLQFCAMVVLSITLWRRHGLTGDFAGFFHAWSAIARGNLNPIHQDAPSLHYIQNHGELITWILAPVYWLIPNGLGLRLIQDVSALGCSVVAYLWVRSLLAQARDVPRSPQIAIGVAAIVLITVDPWPIWANAFDFHWQATGTFFLLTAAYAFWKGRNAFGLGLCALVATTGDVMATILVGLGLSMLFIKRLRIYGVVAAAMGLGTYLVIHHFGGGTSFAAAGGGGGLEVLYGDMFLPEHPKNVSAFGMLLWMASHPVNVLITLAHSAKQMYANLSPAGFVGVFYPMSWGIGLVTLVENNLTSGRMFSQPSFQSFPLYAFIPVGTAALLVALVRRTPPLLVYIACGLLVLNTTAWAAAWLPHIPSRWILVRPAAAAELTRVNAAIPRDQEVIGGEAFLGLFADRPSYYNSIHSSFPIETHPLSIVIAAYDGINELSSNADLSRIAALARNPNVKHISHGNGVWWFSLMAPPGIATIELPFGADIIPAWTLDGVSGSATTEGPPATWKMTYDQLKGDVLSGDYWRLPPGSYEAVAEIEATEPVIFEIRNASGKIVIFRTELPQHAGRNTYRVPFQHAFKYPDIPYSGWGPFQFDQIPFEDNAIELRIWSPGTGKLSIYNIGIVPFRSQPRTIVH